MPIASARRLAGASDAASPQAATSRTPRPNPRAAQLANTIVRSLEKVTRAGSASTSNAMAVTKRRPSRAINRGAITSPTIVVAISAAVVDPAKPTGVPDAVRAVREGTANAGIVYYSAAVAARNEVDAVRFPTSVNMSEAIRNAATVTGSAKNPTESTAFVAFLLSPEGQRILLDAGQPPLMPAILKGAVPAEVKN